MLKRFSSSSNCGKLMLLVGVLVAAPLIVLPFYPQEKGLALSFLLPSLGSCLLGLIVCLFSKRENDDLRWKSSLQHSSLTVLFAWIWGVLVGALPFFFARQLTFLQSLFEAVSGWTTTGLSVIDVTKTPHIFLFHRSFMQFGGGLGFVLMMLVLIRVKQSMNLYNAEGHPDKLMPNLRNTARTIFIIYSALLIIGTSAYRVAGMPLFDGICHAMCSLSTGGFSTKLNSIGEYNSLSIELITIFLMLVGTTNFAVLLLAVKGKWRQFLHVSEMRFMFLLLILCVPIMAWSLHYGMNMGLGESFRRASFDSVSALSTTGYASMSYATWPPLAVGLLILYMLIGGGMGSTAGGIKLTRVYLMFRLTWANMRRRFSPAHKVTSLYYTNAQGKRIIDNDLASDTHGFIVFYCMLFLIGSSLLTLTANCSMLEAMFEFASALGTVGLSIGITNPLTNNGTLIVEMLGMFLGRLEIFIVLFGIYTSISYLRQQLLKLKH